MYVQDVNFKSAIQISFIFFLIFATIKARKSD